jgi:hypothetical protein
MDWITEPERKTPVIAEVDVLVCGGGFAGVAAAVSAARNGVRVLLLEKYGFLGGLCTAALVITTPPLDNGINLTIASLLKERHVYVPCRNSGPEVEGLNLHAIDPEILKYEFVRLLQKHDVDFLFHTYIAAPIMDRRTVCGVVVENKAGRQAIKAKMIVDATGDADIAAAAGAPFRLVRKPMTMMFNIVGVDTDRVLSEWGSWNGIKKAIDGARRSGELEFSLGIHPEFGSPGVYAEKLIYPGELNVWSGNLLNMNGVDPRDLTQAEVVTREHAFRMSEFLRKKIPGFESSRIEITSTQVGVRATRQITGEASPNSEEVRRCEFPDTVVKPYAKSSMRLPYGSILPRNVENLLVAGRCISAEEEAMGHLRLLPVCSATGEAAGTAIALALKQDLSPRNLNVSLLQRTLMEQGVKLTE